MKNKKEVVSTISLHVAAHKANPSPPVGPALGQRKVNIMQFCNEFNERCKKAGYEVGAPIPTKIKVFKDNSFEIETKSPTVTHWIKTEAGLKSGSKTPGTQFVGEIKKAQVRKIAAIKMEDMEVDNIEAAMRMVEGTCVSMGIKVDES